MFSTVVAWNTKTFGDNGPQNWADFWDVEEIPRHALLPQHGHAGTRADGRRRAARQGYEVLSAPGGIDRAIKKLKELKPHIAVWWSSGAQSAQLMKDGAVDMIIGWNGRFDVAAKAAPRSPTPSTRALLDYDCYVIPKGAPQQGLWP